MKVYHSLEEVSTLNKTIVTSGTFDGVHLGHIKILNRLITLAKSEAKETVVITFWPHPRFVLSAEKEPIGLLSSLEEKLATFDQLGIDHVLVIPFTLEFSKISSKEFLSEILVKTLGASKLVIGYDHKFGQNREGSFDYLQANSGLYGFEVEEIPEEDVDDIGISSTRIRKAIGEGDVELASKYLGRHYSVLGIVETGQKLGRTIGFPTANIKISEPHKLLPLDGVYAVKVRVEGGLYLGMMNIGFRPTVNGINRTVEVHLFDFEKDIYNKDITVFFVQRIRSEKKFAGIEELKKQLAQDKETAISILSFSEAIN